METIRERAHNIARQIKEEICLSEHSIDKVAELIENVLVDQSNIDIDNACDWLRENMPYGYDVEHGQSYEEIDLDEFCGAMKYYIFTKIISDMDNRPMFMPWAPENND